MSLDDTANQFLNDCILALQTVKGEFTMAGYTNAQADTDGCWCSTPACVAGHYATMALAVQSIKKRSRKVVMDSDSDDDVVGLAAEVHIGGRPDITGNLTEEQLDELFSDDEVYVDDVEYECGCGGAKTPNQAIKYIRKFILRNGGTLRPLPESVEVQVKVEPVKILHPVEV